jgi:hypothetical protein
MIKCQGLLLLQNDPIHWRCGCLSILGEGSPAVKSRLQWVATVKIRKMHMQTSKAVHWREREAAEWAVRHGALDTFKIHTGEFQARRQILRPVSQAELLEMLADPKWAIIHTSWFAKEFRGSVRIHTLAFLPAALMRSHGVTDVKRYLFEVPDAADVDKALKQKRSEVLGSK